MAKELQIEIAAPFVFGIFSIENLFRVWMFDDRA